MDGKAAAREGEAAADPCRVGVPPATPTRRASEGDRDSVPGSSLGPHYREAPASPVGRQTESSVHEVAPTEMHHATPTRRASEGEVVARSPDPATTPTKSLPTNHQAQPPLTSVKHDAANLTPIPTRTARQPQPTTSCEANTCAAPPTSNAPPASPKTPPPKNQNFSAHLPLSPSPTLPLSHSPPRPPSRPPTKTHILYGYSSHLDGAPPPTGCDEEPLDPEYIKEHLKRLVPVVTER
jgi:hypothetical protein